VLPVTVKLERAFLDQVIILPEASRRFLLVAAVGAAESVPEVLAAARLLGWDLDALKPLEDARLLAVVNDRLQLRHQLLSAAVRGASSAIDLVEIHRAFSTVVSEPLRSAAHLSKATTGQDEAVAAELERVSDQARLRGALPEASGLLTRCAEVSPSGPDRTRRFARAAETARQAGLIPEALSLLSEAQTLVRDDADPDSEVLLETATTQLMLGFMTTEASMQAVDDLEQLSRRLLGIDDVGRRLRVLYGASIAARARNLPHATWRRLESELLSIETPHPMKPMALALLNPMGGQPALRSHLPNLVAGLAGFPLGLQALAIACESVQDLETALTCWNLCYEAHHSTGAVGDETMSLRGRAGVLTLLGRLGEAATDAEQAYRIAQQTQQPVMAAEALAVLARIHATRGDDSAARDALRQFRLSAGTDPLVAPLADASWAAATLATTSGDHSRALEELARTDVHLERMLWSIADRVEAAVNGGALEEIRRPLSQAATVADAYRSPHLMMLVARSQALLADAEGVDGTEEHFEVAIHAGELSGSPLEHARTLLLRGEWLHKQRRVREAREDLVQALDEFDHQGADPLRERATRHLRAAGRVNTEPVFAVRDDTGELTPYEFQIAALAAQGMTNKEIADQLYLSHRTVGTHLYKIFPKLGITKRTQLREALSRVSHRPLGRAG
jgi:DNA-binding CsgD family transcriptional regulator